MQHGGNLWQTKLIQWGLNGKEKEGQASISHLNGAVLKSSAGIRRSMHFITGKPIPLSSRYTLESLAASVQLLILVNRTVKF